MTLASLRAVEIGDWRALNALHRWAQFPERSEDGWAWIHRLGNGHPGWVIEDDHGVCGHFGNLRQDYAFGPSGLVAATGYSLIVLPRARGGSRPLLEAFRSQPGVFAASVFNGNARSSAVYRREQMTPFPAAWADAKIVWPLAPLTIATERLARAVFRDRRATREWFSSHRSGDLAAADPKLIRLDPWRDADKIDRFWSHLKQEQSLVAHRGARVFQARFSDPDRTSDPLLYGWGQDRLSAIALGQVGKMSEREASVLDVIDLAWTGPDGQAAATALLLHLKEVGRQIGASRLRLPMLNSDLVAVAKAVPGSILRRRHTHAHVSFRDGAEKASLWRPTPLDGDYGFCLRPPPSPTQPLRRQETSNAWTQPSSAHR